MFDKLIESNGSEYQPKGRKSFFVVSSLGVGTLAIVGLVVSIFAADYGLGTDKFEISTLVAPVIQSAPEPPPAPAAPRQSMPQSADSKRVTIPTRTQNVLRIDESPKAPTTVSTTRNTTPERPRGEFAMGRANTEVSAGSNRGTGQESGTGLSTGGTSNAPSESTVAQSREIPDPPKPPVREVEPPKLPAPPKVQSMGVINGRATRLPMPIYSAAARAVNAHGTVQVQVLIDENGNVVSANAVSGHPLLQASAVTAARNAKFSPTKLSNVPIKVSGIISYNFRPDA